MGVRGLAQGTNHDNDKIPRSVGVGDCQGVVNFQEGFWFDGLLALKSERRGCEGEGLFPST